MPRCLTKYRYQTDKEMFCPSTCCALQRCTAEPFLGQLWLRIFNPLFWSLAPSVLVVLVTLKFSFVICPQNMNNVNALNCQIFSNSNCFSVKIYKQFAFGPSQKTFTRNLGTVVLKRQCHEIFWHFFHLGPCQVWTLLLNNLFTLRYSNFEVEKHGVEFFLNSLI